MMSFGKGYCRTLHRRRCTPFVLLSAGRLGCAAGVGAPPGSLVRSFCAAPLPISRRASHVFLLGQPTRSNYHCYIVLQHPVIVLCITSKCLFLHLEMCYCASRQSATHCISCRSHAVGSAKLRKYRYLDIKLVKLIKKILVMLGTRECEIHSDCR
jgi:hypothetical protein